MLDELSMGLLRNQDSRLNMAGRGLNLPNKSTNAPVYTAVSWEYMEGDDSEICTKTRLTSEEHGYISM